MEKQYDNNNSGALFTNDRKKSDTHPDLTGSCEVDGKDYWFKAWKKTSKKGLPFLSVSFDPKETDVVSSGVAPQSGDPVPQNSEPIPF